MNDRRIERISSHSWGRKKEGIRSIAKLTNASKLKGILNYNKLWACQKLLLTFMAYRSVISSNIKGNLSNVTKIMYR